MKILETNLKFTSLSKRNKTDLILIHHVGTMPKNTKVDAKLIHQWHKDKGWAGIGYHFVILKDGTVERGRPVDTVGAHCSGVNSHSIGVNVVGNFEIEKPTEEQIKSLVELLKYLKKKYPNTQIKGHKDCQANNCPGKNLYSQIGKIKYYVTH